MNHRVRKNINWRDEDIRPNALLCFACYDDDGNRQGDGAIQIKEHTKITQNGVFIFGVFKGFSDKYYRDWIGSKMKRGTNFGVHLCKKGVIRYNTRTKHKARARRAPCVP